MPSDSVPAGWRAVRLGDLGAFSTSSVDKKFSASETPVSLVNYMDVYRHRFIDSSLHLMRVTATRAERSRFRLQVGDILFTPSSETPDDIGHSAVVVENLPDTLHSYHTVRLRPHAATELELRFSVRVANGEQVLAQFTKRAAGSTRFTLSLDAFRAAIVALPPPPEQGRIAEILDTIDEAIRRTEQVIAKLQQMKQGLLHDLLTQGIGDDGELRDPVRSPGHFKDTALGRRPASWSLVALETLVDVLDHLRIPVNSDERANRPGDVPYYGANGQQGWIDRPLFNEPLILLAEDGGTFDEFATRPIAYRIDGPSWVNNHAHIIRAVGGVDQGFVFWSLVHKDIRRYIAGGTRSKLTQGELRVIELSAPPYHEQQAIARVLDQHEERISREQRHADKLRNVKSGLMRDLLTGRVRVSALEEVPA